LTSLAAAHGIEVCIWGPLFFVSGATAPFCRVENSSHGIMPDEEEKI
jgi:hypothetical protein